MTTGAPLGPADEADEWLAAASRHADAVADPATDEWWAALFADLDARMAEAGTGSQSSGDHAERRVLTEAALRRLALSREPPPPTVIVDVAADPSPTVGGNGPPATISTDTSKKAKAPKAPKPPKPPKPPKAPKQKRRSKHVTERYGALRRIRSGIALIFLAAFTGAVLAAVAVAVAVVIVLAFRRAAG